MASSNLKAVSGEPEVIAPQSAAGLLLREASEANAPVVSQALILQQSLERRFSNDRADRWPVGVRVTFILASSASLWAAIIAMLTRL